MFSRPFPHVLLVVFAWCTLSCTAFARDNDPLVQQYLSFAQCFEKQDFKNAALYVVSMDTEAFAALEVQDVADTASVEVLSSSVPSIEHALEDIWKTYHDPLTKKEKLLQLDAMKKEQLDEMNLALADLKRLNAVPEDITALTQSIAAVTEQADRDVLFTTATTYAFGPVLEKVVHGEYAVLVVEARYVFTKDALKKANQIVAAMPLSPDARRHTRLSGTTLSMPTLYTWVQENGTWKFMLFSRTSFPVESFEDVFARYDMPTS